MTAALRQLRSVRGRITLVSTALVALTLVLASMLLLRLVREDLLATAEDTIDQALESQAEQFEAAFGFDAELGIAAELIEPDSEFEGDVAIEAIDASDGALLGSDDVVLFEVDPTDPEGLAFGEFLVADDTSVLVGIDPETGQVVEVYDPILDEPLTDAVIQDQLDEVLFETYALEDTGGTRFLVGTAPLDEIEQSVAAVGNALMVIVPALTLLLGLSVWLLVGRALQPVMSITKQVEAISSSNLDQRVPVPATGDEVADLASVMNRMLDRLERGGERQRQFSADASHELRSPLSSVRAAAEMIGRKPDGERVTLLADDILAESDRMNHLIGDLLELSRLDEDRRSIAMEDLNLSQLVQQELRPDVAEGSVRLMAPPSLTVNGSPGQLRRVARNLVDNAVRHAEQQVVVTLAVPLGGRFVLTVEDDGPGIPAEDRELIFERFGRLDAARGRDSGGSGLGLSLVMAIVEHHGGTITVDDSPLGGARFTVTA